ncbi:DNA adenine methylase [Listeria monocytogenes]|uniref:DNA adenine methylase n=1 Tax=Listeria monocytogenes TaxID=1639 RepID=UPI000E714BBB|nr:DNA adenine methylase [Listeria monocytogenes]EAC3063106.1 DNA adenine methylase [Listeria monocytogenes]EAC4260825.1 DNA adenine methylase [Listeria monocytogenes]EAE7323087.1 DNA adenine methylase [Listeria monocytogenes]EAW7174515.1 DNA adenine methylase [Listeria monocytogenes]EBD1590244.1 DNA adenine methylase [Listeria monocytogenes]
MRAWRSPLRYPGGKYNMLKFVEQVLKENDIDGTYIEAFAGGAGLAVNLLLTNQVERVILNDLDIAVYSFWWSLVNRNDDFLLKFDLVQVTIDEWHNQKIIFDDLSSRKRLGRNQKLDLGFATYFLNRTNFSGILRGATPIGGLNQNGKWKIDCQFKKKNLRPLLEEIGKYNNQITVTRLDMIRDFQNLVTDCLDVNNSLLFIDPPYVKEGRRLYLPIKEIDEHKKLAKKIIQTDYKWLLTYDLHEELLPLYSEINQRFRYKLRYYVKNKRDEYEFLALSDNLNFPKVPLLNDWDRLLDTDI